MEAALKRDDGLRKDIQWQGFIHNINGIGLCKSSSVPNEAQMLIVGPIEEVRERVSKEVDYT